MDKSRVEQFQSESCNASWNKFKFCLNLLFLINDPLKDKLEDILVRTLYDNDQHTEPKISQARFQNDNFSWVLTLTTSDLTVNLTSSNNFKTVSKLALLKIALYLDRTEDAENLLDSSKLKTINTNNWKRQMLYALNNKDRDFNSSLWYLKSIGNQSMHWNPR